MSGNPSKPEITQIFKRLRAIPANKVCFDCNSKNPTWSSITYGIFICIDCSGIHRSLGVHLTFVRSTQLDYNWTWQQLRQMQLGGNANAMAFFRKHNVSTADTAVKYKSRAAQLYRDKLHQNAAHAHRVHGTKLFIDTAAHKDEDEQGEEEEDFFENHSQPTAPTKTDNSDAEESAISAPVPSLRSTASTKTATINQESNGGAPNVEAALSMSPTPQTEVRKSTIGQRKPLGKKTGLGAKKGGGLGAQKAKKSFAEIEREAEMADQIKERMEQERKVNEAKRIEDEAVAAANMKLAYQDMSAKSKKAEEQIRRVDSKKADQFERLGMGAAASASKSAISHSAVSDAIVQEEPVAKSGGGGSSRSGGFSARGSSFMARDFEDDFEIVSAGDTDFRLGGSSGNGSRNRDDNDGFEGFGGGGGSSSNWERDFEAMKLDSKKSRNNNTDWSNAFEEEPIKKQTSSFASSSSSSRSRPESLATPAAAVDVQKKFGSAKAISSDMVFGNQRDDVPDANLSRFQGSSSISSAEFFGREEQARGGGGYGAAAANIQTPDMEDVKESVRQGVSKVAGKLSNMASGVMTQLQDKYGY